MNFEPSSTLLSTLILPPKAFIIVAHVVSPMPIPSVLIWLLACNLPKTLNNLEISSSLMPMPVSYTVISKSTASTRDGSRLLTITEMDPLNVNLTEFVSKLSNTYLSL